MCEKCTACSEVVEILTDNGFCLECEADYQVALLNFEAVEDEMYDAYLAQQDGFQEYLESPQVIAEGKALELYHGEVE